jgi:glycine cleavage system H protein
MRYYSEDHMWLDLCEGVATLGVSPHAAAELGELTFVELPTPGTHIARGDVLCVVESLKTAADLCCPVGGTVCAANHLLRDRPAGVNSSPEGEGWICRLTNVAPSDIARLLTAEQYETFLATQAGR